LFGFLPAAVLGFAVAGRLGRTAGAVWLVIASLVFYGFWQPALVVLISASILFNYAIASLIRRNEGKDGRQTSLLWTGIALNLIALIYYKYAFWLLSLLGKIGIVDTHGLHAIVLPLGISFFTFTQIGYLVDCRQKVTKEDGFLNYVLFVTFFPHLIAGPILHNGEIMPQFADPARFRLNAANIGAGLTMFVIGLLKKSLIADSLANINNQGFLGAEHLQFFGSWGTLLGYSLQLYFDFSGYSDMAIGLALLFNIRFPLNFDSPYKARSIIDFWQRWHMTLTRYITLYLYNPIAMNFYRRRMKRGLPMGRKALAKPWPFAYLIAVPTFITMALAGIWHGAGLQFLIFGLLHAVYLTINHAWRTFGPKTGALVLGRLARGCLAVCQVLITYSAVLIAQAFFRAASVSDAVSILSAMLGAKGFEHPLSVPKLARSFLTPFAHRLIEDGAIDFHLSHDMQMQALMIPLAFVIVWLLPNSQQIMAGANPVLTKVETGGWRILTWRPTFRWAIAASGAAAIALMSIGGTHEFLYFQF
jgi:D-alanyl-lipoteichoic acid acyltransferase DltB (MBOAT superfamily)